MTRAAIVNYRVHKPERQACHTDAGGVICKLISSEQAVIKMVLNETRNGSTVSFEIRGVGAYSVPSEVANNAM